jgi:hypothetical protein
MSGRSRTCLLDALQSAVSALIVLALAILALAVLALAVSASLLTPGLALAQSNEAQSDRLKHNRAEPDRVPSAPDFSLPPSLPEPVQPPDRAPREWPVQRPPHLPVVGPGTFDLPQIVQAAGTIFSGTVTAITNHAASLTPGRQQAVGTVAVTFHVERAIRGAIPGESLSISQWIGTWSSGQRYRIGDRALVFLYPRSKIGLTSCVGGSLGRFRIDPLGHVSLTAQQLSAFRKDPVLGGKSRVSFADFAQAVERVDRQEDAP